MLVTAVHSTANGLGLENGVMRADQDRIVKLVKVWWSAIHQV